MITQKELAELAGISRPALSMYLNAPNTSHLSEAKKRKLDALIRQYNYHPNLAARSLQGKKLQLVGIAGNLFNVPIHSAMIETLNRKLMEHGYQAILGDFSGMTSDEGVERIIQEFIWRKIDLLFLFNDYPSGKLIEFPGPVIRITENHRIFDICTDLRLAGKIAAEHLLSCGRRNLAYLSMPSSSHRELRLSGMIDALQQAGFTASPEELDPPFSDDLAQQIQNRKIDGIFCVNEFVAAKLYQKLAVAGLRIPDDVSVVGFDGLPMGELLMPPLTSIAQPVEEIAEKAVALMNAKFCGENPAEIQWFAPRLCIRESSVISPRLQG